MQLIGELCGRRKVGGQAGARKAERAEHGERIQARLQRCPLHRTGRVDTAVRGAYTTPTPRCRLRTRRLPLHSNKSRGQPLRPPKLEVSQEVVRHLHHYLHTISREPQVEPKAMARPPRPLSSIANHHILIHFCLLAHEPTQPRRSQALAHHERLHASSSVRGHEALSMCPHPCNMAIYAHAAQHARPPAHPRSPCRRASCGLPAGSATPLSPNLPSMACRHTA